MEKDTLNYTVVAVGIIGFGAMGAWVLWARRWFVGPLRTNETGEMVVAPDPELEAVERAELPEKESKGVEA